MFFLNQERLGRSPLEQLKYLSDILPPHIASASQCNQFGKYISVREFANAFDFRPIVEQIHGQHHNRAATDTQGFAGRLAAYHLRALDISAQPTYGYVHDIVYRNPRTADAV